MEKTQLILLQESSSTQRLWQQLEKTSQWKVQNQKLNAKHKLAQSLRHVFI